MVSATLYKRFGISNADIGWYTSLLGLAWVVKPLWGPLVDLYWSKRKWVLTMQALMFLGFVLTAFVLPTPLWWVGTLVIFSLMAFASATHDIAADGFYMLGLDPHRQALFNGIRSTFWRLSMIIGTGVLVIVAGVLESKSGPQPVKFDIAIKPARDAQHLPIAEKSRGGDFAIVTPSSLKLDGGTTAVLSLRLARAPENQTTAVLNIGPDLSNAKWYSFFVPVGNESLVKFKDADRIEIAPDRWDRETTILLTVDKNVNKPALAHYQVASGDIPNSWAKCLGLVAAVFGLLWIGHMVTLPKPEHDGQKAGDRPPFVRAAFWLILAVGIPTGVLWGIYEYIKPKLVTVVVPQILAGMDPASISGNTQKNLGDLLGFGVWAVLGFVVYLVMLSRGVRQAAGAGFSAAAKQSGIPFDRVFITFFQKPQIGRMIAFLLLYRLADALLVKMIAPFMLDPVDKGGLGLSTTQQGFAYGTIGVFGLLLGGIFGGVFAATRGLLKARFTMCCFMNLPILLFVFLGYYQPNFLIVCGSVFVEQFGYGFGFSMYMLYMLFIAGQGEHKASHYALCTGFMALSFMLPGMLSGILQEFLGYEKYFVMVLGLAVLSFVSIYIIPIDPEFGKKKAAA